MAQASVDEAPLRVKSAKRGGNDPGRASQVVDSEALTNRLKAKADAADRGNSVSLAGKTDDEIIAALTRR